MRDIDWNILVTLFDNKNITKTARIFYLSQPTLTKRIQMIEEELGAQLIIRHTKGISFTPKGETAVNYGRKMLNLLNEVHECMTMPDQWDEGTLSLGVSASISRYAVPAILSTFVPAHPLLNLEISNYISEDTADLVLKKRLDFGIICANTPSPKLCYQQIREEPCYLVSREPLDIDQLPNYPRIISTLNEYSSNLLKGWWNERFSVPGNCGLSIADCNVALQMIHKGFCYGLIFYRGKDAFNGLNARPLHYLDGRPLVRKSWLIYHADREHEPLISNFAKAVGEIDFSQY